MQTSQFIAGLIGPLFIVIAVGILFRRDQFEVIAEQATRNQALIFFAGMILLVCGLAIVRFHNTWEWSWTLIVTLFGWLSIIGGIARMLYAGQVESIREAVGKNELGIKLTAWGCLLLGAFLSVKGYGLFGL